MPTAQTRNSKTFSIRLLTEEFEAIKSACKALSSPSAAVDVSQLFSTAAITEAARLGFHPDTYEDQPVRFARGWANAPQRPEELSLEARTSITIHPFYLRTIEQAAKSVKVNVASFLVGSVLRFIRTRQQLEPNNKPLQKIVLPEQYRD
jgi:hypothetical protein